MTRKELVKLISKRLIRIREYLKYSRAQMAGAMGSSESSYYKNEIAKTSPDIVNYYSIARTFNVSLDWLIVGRGDMFYQEPEPMPNPPIEGSPREEPALMGEGLRQDVKELLDHMEHIPMLRYEVLSMFQHFKANNKELVAETMKDTKKQNEES
jgi:transcriptional regulator with XRE-family HTH domain